MSWEFIVFIVLVASVSFTFGLITGQYYQEKVNIRDRKELITYYEDELHNERQKNKDIRIEVDELRDAIQYGQEIHFNNF